MMIECERNQALRAFRPLRRGRSTVPLGRALLGALAVFLLLATQAGAATIPFDLSGFARTDLRALAMGNAFGSIARGEAALYYNPAGLVQQSFDIRFEGTFLALGDDAFLSDVYTMLSGNPDAAAITAFLTDNLGKTQYFNQELNYSGVAALAKLNMGFGMGIKNQTRYSFIFTDNGPAGFDVTDTMTEDEQVLGMTTISAAFPLLEGQMLVGVTLKYFSFDDKTASDTFGNVLIGGVSLATAGDSYSGRTYDLGMLWRMESFSALRGQFSFVANNIGGLNMVGGTNTLVVPASYDVGISISPELKGSPFHMLFSLDYEDLTGAILVQDSVGTDHSRSLAQQLHFGAELGFWETGLGNNILSLRLGNNRGQITYGGELNFSFFRLLVTQYKEDVGWSGAKDIHTFKAIQASVGIGF